jgi:hypothetical protein
MRRYLTVFSVFADVPLYTLAAKLAVNVFR